MKKFVVADNLMVELKDYIRSHHLKKEDWNETSQNPPNHIGYRIGDAHFPLGCANDEKHAKKLIYDIDEAIKFFIKSEKYHIFYIKKLWAQLIVIKKYNTEDVFE